MTLTFAGLVIDIVVGFSLLCVVVVAGLLIHRLVKEAKDD